MLSTFRSTLPLLVVVEGENDISFLRVISAMLHRHNAALPDLAQLASACRIVFWPNGGSSLKASVARLACLQLQAFYVLDREQEPQTSERRQVLAAVNRQPGCFGVLTGKRALENYLHPLAIKEACGIELPFHDNSNVAGMLAWKMMTRSGWSCWQDLPCKRQKRLHERAKIVLNRKAVRYMTPTLLDLQDPQAEITGWLQTIQQTIEPHARSAGPP